MAYNYPYGDSQQLNLEWFISKFNTMVQEWQTAEAGIAGALSDEIARVEAAMTDLYTARDAAISAKNDAVSAKNAASGSATAAYGSETAAASSASAAMTNGLKSEGFAVGEQNTSPVQSGSPYYENNAKYYAGEASTSATNASQSASNAGTSETNAGNSATAAGNAKTAAETAALEAEGFAVGEQNGTPVSSGSPYYQDNSKYYATQAGNSATAASTSETNAHNSELAAAASAASSDGAAAQAMIAELESSTTAAAAHSTGEYFRLNGVLYIATADIAIGDTITVGTNCQQAVLGDNVSELKSAFLLNGSGTDVIIPPNTDILSLPVGSYVSQTSANTQTLTNIPEGLTASFRLLIFTRPSAEALTYLLNATARFYVTYRSTNTLYTQWHLLQDERETANLQTQIDAISTKVNNIPICVSKIEKKWFEKGGIGDSGQNSTYRPNSRMRTPILYFVRDTQISLDTTTYPTAEMSVFYFDYSGNLLLNTSWLTNAMIPAGSYCRFLVTLNKSAGSSVTNTIDEIFACIISGAVLKPSYFRTVKIASHQGNTNGADTNHCKLDGYINAGKLGYDYIEGDVKFSADNVPVMCHDSSFEDATTGDTVTIRSTTFAALRTHDYYGGTIASLEEVVAVAKKYGMMLMLDQIIDTWSDAMYAAIFGILNKYRFWEYTKFLVTTSEAATKIITNNKKANLVAEQAHASADASAAITLANSIITDYNHVDVLLYNGLGETIISNAAKSMDSRFGLITYHNDDVATKQLYAKYSNILLTNTNSALFNY